jgi:hypothetical protein
MITRMFMAGEFLLSFNKIVKIKDDSQGAKTINITNMNQSTVVGSSEITVA